VTRLSYLVCLGFTLAISSALVPSIRARSAKTSQTPGSLDSPTSNPSKNPIPKCAMVGTWRSTITIPDGADGVPALVVLRFSELGGNVTVKGWANNKPLAIANVTASCDAFSFVIPQGKVPVTFSGKLSDDKRAVSGTAKRQDVSASWSLQRQS
jgi:hypothetical protein